jgi:hypothetical protein
VEVAWASDALDGELFVAAEVLRSPSACAPRSASRRVAYGNIPVAAPRPGVAVRKEAPRCQIAPNSRAWRTTTGGTALSQRAAFEATYASALAAARRFADERVRRVVDLGAADGVNSHGLIRNLAEQRAGRPLIYALVDLPTNAWGVAGEHLGRAFGEAADGSRVVVIPAQGDAGPGVADAGTGAHYASPEAQGEACRRAVQHGPPPATVISMAGIPLQRAPCLPADSVHVAVSGTAMHWSRMRPAWRRRGPSSRATRTT